MRCLNYFFLSLEVSMIKNIFRESSFKSPSSIFYFNKAFKSMNSMSSVAVIYKKFYLLANSIYFYLYIVNAEEYLVYIYIIKLKI